MDRGGPPGKNSRPRVCGKTLQVDGDIDFHFPQAFRDFVVACARHVKEARKRTFKPLTHPAAIVGSEGERVGFEATAVVLLEQSRRQRCRRVCMEIGGYIGKTNALMPVSLSAPQRRAGREISLRKNAGTVQLIFGGTAEGRGDHGRHSGFSRADIDEGLLPSRFQALPVADLDLAANEAAACGRGVRVRSQDILVVAYGVGIAPQFQERVCAIDLRTDERRIQSQCAIEARGGFIEPLHRGQRGAAIAPQLRSFRMIGDCAIDDRERVVEAAALELKPRQSLSGIEVCRVGFENLAIASLRVRKSPRLVQPGSLFQKQFRWRRGFQRSSPGVSLHAGPQNLKVLRRPDGFPTSGHTPSLNAG